MEILPRARRRPGAGLARRIPRAEPAVRGHGREPHPPPETAVLIGRVRGPARARLGRRGGRADPPLASGRSSPASSRSPSGGRRRSARPSRSTSRRGALPGYTLLSLSRGFAAYLLSLVFTLVYGTIAAHARRAEKVLDPAARHRAGHPRPRVPAGARPRHGRALPADERRARARLRRHDLHGAGLEHGVLVHGVPPLDPDRAAARSRGSTASRSGNGSGPSRSRRP